MVPPLMSSYLQRKEDRHVKNHDQLEKLIRTSVRRTKKDWLGGVYSKVHRHGNLLSVSVPPNTCVVFVDVRTGEVNQGCVVRVVKSRSDGFPCFVAVRVNGAVLAVPLQICTATADIQPKGDGKNIQ